MRYLVPVGALALGTTLAWAGPEPAAPTRYWTALPDLDASIGAAMAVHGGGTARVSGDAGVGCFAAELETPAPGASLAAVRAALEDGLREAGAVVSLGETEGRTRFRLGAFDGVVATSVDPAAKTARAAACLCRDRYPDVAERACQQITEAVTR